MKAKIAEVFESMQGEGIYLGERQIFVRFFGCNLSCSYCDTKINNSSDYDIEELTKKIKLFKGDFHSISFTGGEPLLQKDFLKEAMKKTRELGFKNYLETNGTLPEAMKEVIDCVDIVSMDIKLPSSTGCVPFWEEHEKFLKLSSEKDCFLKAIICQSSSVKDLKEAIGLIKRVDDAKILVLQPNSLENYVMIKEKVEDFKNICQKEGINTCVIPQVHKILGVK